MPDFMITYLVYGFLGFICEEIYCSIGEKKFTWRGFLYGPFLPVYAFGGLGIVLLLSNFKSNGLVVFLLSFLLASAIEYIASFAMEKVFNMKWWDYSHYKFNIRGRVCLLNSTLFGIGGMVVIYIIEPYIDQNIFNINTDIRNIIAFISYLVLFSDVIFSVYSIIKAKNYLNKYSGLLKNKIEELKSNHPKPSYYLNRFQRAFPRLESVKNKLTVANFRKKLSEIRTEYAKTIELAKKKIEK